MGDLSASMALANGTRIGVYEIVGSLGSGGMGEVYRAVDTSLGRHVAIKVLPEAFAQDVERLARFEREARVLATLNHPNIAQVYGFERTTNTRALVMELVEGPTLAERISDVAPREGAPYMSQDLGGGRPSVERPFTGRHDGEAHGFGLPLDEALPIATQIAEALEAAHEHGVVHRDLKPANIKVRPDGVVKVLDFGLAKALDVGRDFSPAGHAGPGDPAYVPPSQLPTITPPALMTGAGMILGTAAYMSPEQAKGRAADRRSDLWSFGCVLFEMLTGTRPFVGEDVADTLAAVLRGDPDWSAIPPSTPTHVIRLIRLCLERDPKKRLQSAGDARIRLAEVGTADTAPPAPHVVPGRAGARAWQITAVALALLAAGLAVALSRPAATVDVLETRTEIVTPATSDPNSFAISPDGRQAVFVASGDGAPKLWLRSLAETTARPLPGTDGAVYPFWSPDSRAVAYFAGGKLRRLDLGAGKSTALADVGGMRGGTWGADGTILFARGTAGALLRVPASGGEPVSVGTLSDGQSNHRFPIFLPDGRWFLYFALGTPETQGIYLGSLDSLQVTRLTPAGSAGAYVGDGWLAWVREGGLVAQKLDLELQRLVGEPVTVTDQLTWDELIQAPAVSVSAAGAMIYRTGGAAALELRWFDARGQALGLLGMPSESLITPRLSPNGARAAVVRAVEGNVDVWLIDSVRASRVTVDPASDQFPIWSPDGNRIAFRSNRTAAGVYNLFVTLASSVGGESPVFESPRDKVPQDWSRDGKFLLFAENNQRTGWDLWALPLEGSREPFVVLDAPSDERQVTFSPDGRWLAYYSNQSGRYEVYVRPFVVPGSKTAGPTVPQWQASTGGGVFSKWRADGRALYYESLDGQIMAVPVTVSGEQVQVGRPVAVFRPGIFAAGGDLGRGRQWDVAPDGRFLVNTVRDVASPLVVIQNWKPPAPR